VGGKLALRDFEFVVINPLSGIGLDTCLAPPKPLSMSLGRCIEARGRAREQIANNLDQTPLFHSLARMLDAAHQPVSRPLLRPTATRGGYIPPMPSATASTSVPRPFDPLRMFPAPTLAAFTPFAPSMTASAAARGAFNPLHRYSAPPDQDPRNQR